LAFLREKLQKRLGFFSHYSQIEAGKRIPSLEVFINISEALKVSPDNLIYGEKNGKSSGYYSPNAGWFI